MTRYRQFCALARAAELVGERWTLLIVRELLLGPRRFADLQRGLSGVSPALLSQRLGYMEESDLVQRSVLPPPAAVAIYELTPHGEALRPAVHELIRWGGRFLLPAQRSEDFEPEWMRLALEACARKGPTPHCSVRLRVTRGQKYADMLVTSGPNGVRLSGDVGPAADVTLTAPFETVFKLASGAISVEQAAADGGAEITGSVAALAYFPSFFDMFEPRSHSRTAPRTRGGPRRGHPRKRRAKANQRT